MLSLAPLTETVVSFGEESGREEPAAETLGDDIDGLGAGMQHVGGIEAVVAQFIKEYLVGRKIVGESCVLKRVAEEEQGGLLELRGVEAVLFVTIRADGEEDTDLRIEMGDAKEDFLPRVFKFLLRGLLLDEEAGRLFVAVGDERVPRRLMGSTQMVGPGGAKGDNDEACRAEGLPTLLPGGGKAGAAFLFRGCGAHRGGLPTVPQAIPSAERGCGRYISHPRVQQGGNDLRRVERAERIDAYAALCQLMLQALPHFLCETGAEAQDVVVRRQLEGGGGQFYRCGERRKIGWRGRYAGRTHGESEKLKVKSEK